LRDCEQSRPLFPNFGYIRLFGTSALENALQYRQSDSKIFNSNILATAYANMTKIGSVTLEITTVTNALFWMGQQTLTDPTEYLGKY